MRLVLSAMRASLFIGFLIKNLPKPRTAKIAPSMTPGYASTFWPN